MNLRTNPFDRFLSKEQVMQAEVARRLSIEHPDVFWWHTHNEGKKSPFEQYLFKKMGGHSGVSDFVILEESNFSKGLMLELKFGANKCTRNQVEFMKHAAKKGFTCCVVYNHHQDAVNIINRHLGSGIGILPNDGILLVKGSVEKVIPFSQALDVLCSKSKEKEQVKKLFSKKASSKFGKSVPGKLFQSSKSGDSKLG